MADIFVSYARADKARVAPLVAALEAEGWSVWWDPEIVPGQEFDALIAEELQKAAAVIVVWTPTSVASRWVKGEAREAADRNVLVPVRFEGVRLPIDVRAIHTTDLDDWQEDPQSAAFRTLARAVKPLVRGSAAPALSAAPGTGSEAAGGEAKRISICVLAFTNMSGDPGQEFLSDGITEDIITDLSRWPSLAVTSRHTTFRLKDQPLDVQRIGRELGVNFVVEGSLRRLGDRIRITAQLVDTQTGSHVWAERFDRPATDLFDVQDEVVRTIVGTLAGRAHASEATRLRRKPPTSLTAYELTLRGNALSWEDPATAPEAKAAFEQAIGLDPDYGPPYSLLSSFLRWQWVADLSAPASDLDHIVALARRGVFLGGNENVCQMALAMAYLYQRSWDLALHHIEQAFELNPANPRNQAEYGLVQAYLGSAEKALEHMRIARRMDPYFPAPWYWRAVGVALFVIRDYAGALTEFDRSTTRRPRFAYGFQAACCARLGFAERARELAAKALEGYPGAGISHLLAKVPFKREADTEHLAECLRLAGMLE